MTAPKITIITVNFNMAAGLARTIASIEAQRYANLEFIVIDGGSIDGSVELVRRHEDRIAGWLSEPDRGIYDAMNKGVRQATGEWLIFMNAGDTFHDYTVVSDIFSGPQDDADIIYGDMVRSYERENVQRLVPALPLSALPLRMPCSHQSLFTRRPLLQEMPFSNELSIAADHDFLLRAKLAGARFRKIDRTIGIFGTGGKSDINRLEALRQLYRILDRHRLLTPTLRLRHAALLVRGLAGATLKKLLPKQWTRWILAHRPLG